MRTLRPVIAADPKLFGRRRLCLADQGQRDSYAVGDDLRLFATTFTIGFLFVSVLIF